MGSWWLSLGFQPIYGIHVCPTKETQAPTATNHGFPNVRWKEVFISYIDEFADVLSRWQRLQKKNAETGKAEEDFFGEFWSTIFGTTELWEHFFSRSSVFVLLFFQFQLRFSRWWSAIWSFWSLDFWISRGKKTCKSIEGWIGSIDSIYIRWKLIFFLSKTKSTILEVLMNGEGDGLIDHKLVSVYLNVMLHSPWPYDLPHKNDQSKLQSFIILLGALKNLFDPRVETKIWIPFVSCRRRV